MATDKDLARSFKAIQQSNSSTKHTLIKTDQKHVESDVYDVYPF